MVAGVLKKGVLNKSDMDGRIDRAVRLHEQVNVNRVAFLQTDLEACLTLTSVAATEYQAGAREAGDRARGEAEKGFSTISRMLSDPKHADHLTYEQHRHFSEGLGRLRRRLDALSF
jgi:hypothetical protein